MEVEGYACLQPVGQLGSVMKKLLHLFVSGWRRGSTRYTLAVGHSPDGSFVRLVMLEAIRLLAITITTAQCRGQTVGIHNQLRPSCTGFFGPASLAELHAEAFAGYFAAWGSTKKLFRQEWGGCIAAHCGVRTLIELFESKERGPVAPIFFRFRPIGVHAIINYGQSKAEKWPKNTCRKKF